MLATLNSISDYLMFKNLLGYIHNESSSFPSFLKYPLRENNFAKYLKLRVQPANILPD